MRAQRQAAREAVEQDAVICEAYLLDAPEELRLNQLVEDPLWDQPAPSTPGVPYWKGARWAGNVRLWCLRTPLGAQACYGRRQDIRARLEQ